MSSAFAQPNPGFSTFRISWSADGATAVPTMSTYGILLLAVLLAIVVFRVSRNRGYLVRAIAPLATFGVAAAFAVMTQPSIAGFVMTPPIDVSSCSGSETYTADGPNPPPCFVNTCGSPVTVSYTFIDGEEPDTTPITDGTCTRNYYCGDDEGASAATQGAVIPSDGLSYATAYCEEIFGGLEG